MGLIRITPPSLMPVSLAEAKAALRIDGTDEDALVTRYIAVATAALDGADGLLGRALITSTWKLSLDAFPLGPIALPLPPTQAVTSITYLDTSGAQQTLSPSLYTVRGIGEPDGATIHRTPGAAWPATLGLPVSVAVSFRCGYGDAATDVPEPIRQAILAAVGTMVTQREGAIVSTATVHDFGAVGSDLIEPYRIRSFGA